MRKIILLCALLAAPVMGRADPSPFTSQKEIEAFFDASPVRLAIYTEYIVAPDFKELAVQNSWANISADKSDGKDARTEKLSALVAALTDIEAQWSDGIRRVLDISSLTRAEMDQIIKYMLDRRAVATQVKKQINGALASLGVTPAKKS
ncbi:MAG: hypothetical protein ABIZ04_03820 [Opitutus sp.]